MTVAEAVAGVRARIERAAASAGRDPSSIRLVAVTKGVDPARALEAVKAGAGDLGENRVRELLSKQAELADGAPRWHMIGSLQRNKARHVAGRVDLIHSIDSVALAENVGRAARDAGAIQPVLLQVNASRERSKHGVPPSDALDVARAIALVDGLELRGVMTMAPMGDAESARACFATLRAVRDEIARAVPGATELSMGMSGDFEIAITEGATIVRIGTAIFGPREHP